MAVIKKTLFPKNLDKFAVLVNDTQSDSKYFKITELPDTFTGGKNAFLIAGSEYLVPDTKIQIELKSSDGNIIYHEPGEGLISSSIGGEAFVTEYYEGVSKVVAVYIYPDTSYGPCTLTILGELSEYEDGNGIMTPVPLDWEGKYNVKWQKQIDVNPSLPNITKIRFYRRPTPTINELVEPIYRIETGSKVPTGVNQSFADIKLSNLETFAGDVKRVKVFRTSEGTISDYDLIQDILVESKELLTSFGLSGSVVGNTGIFTQETLKNYWNTGSLTTQLTSSRVESGLKLNGSGLLTYTTSLDLKSANTYELNLDAFYSSSTKSNLGLWVSYVSQSTTFSSSIGTLYGLNPTTNLLDSTFPFKIDRDYPTASLYLSQSQGEWHVGNISLKLSQDTAFSPDEISFITTMPTVVGNETFNFKFEFYDVNNNYVPVAVTQSVLFTGGTTSSVDVDFIISSSLSQSLDALYTVSSSISGTVTFNSSSISGSLTNVSSSISGSITTLSSSVSQSVALTLSSSLSKVQQLANGQYSGSFIGDTVIYSPAIGGQVGYIKELFTVGDNTSSQINLDARTSTRKIYIGTGTYNNTNTSVYLDSTGKFSLKQKLVFDGNDLSITGNLTVGSVVPNSVVSGLKALALKDTVSSTEIDNGAVTEAKIGTNAVSNTKIANDAITEAKIATNAVTSGKITANAIIAEKIATDAIVADKIAAGAITAIKIDTGAVNADKIAAGAITAGKIDANAITAGNIQAGAITAGKIATDAIVAGNIQAGAVTAGKISVSELSALNATIGGWSISNSQIYNSNVQIDNSNSRIDFLSGGVVKTRIKSGNADIGSFTTTAITVGSGTTSQTSQNGSSISPGPLVVQNSSGGNAGEATFTTPSAANGRPFSITIPYPAVSTIGFSQVTSFGTGTSWDWSYSAGITYTIRLDNMSGALVASGTKILAQGSASTTLSSTGIVTHPGFSGGTMIIPNLATAVSGQVYWINVYIATNVQTRINPSGATPIGSGGSATSLTYGWQSTTGNAGLLAVANRAEYATNGAQIGSAEGTYVAFGDAAGSGYVGAFNGNVQVVGVLAAGSISASDKRAKTNIETIQNGIDTIKKLNPVKFDWLPHITGNNEFEKGYGFIADDIENILPDLVYQRKGYQFDDFKHLEYNSFHAIAIKAIQELTEKVEKLEAKISGSI